MHISKFERAEDAAVACSSWGPERDSTNPSSRGSSAVSRWRSEIEAAEAYDRVARHERGARAMLNFPDRQLVPTSLKAMKKEMLQRRKSQTASRYVGVIFNEGLSFPWAANLNRHGRSLLLGSYLTEREAAIAYDRAMLHEWGPNATLNFPTVSRRLGPALPETLRAEAHAAYKKTTTSSYRGVTWNHRAEVWVARIGHARRLLGLGTFRDEVEAACAYDEAARRLQKEKAKPNFPE